MYTKEIEEIRIEIIKYKQLVESITETINNTCNECWNGKHDNFDNDVHLTIIRDPVLNKIYRREYLCKKHRDMFSMDGFKIYLKEK